MGQKEIIDILGKKRLTRREIENLIDISQVAISRALKQLLKYNEISIDRSNGIPVYSIIKKRKRGRNSPSK